MKFNSTQLNKSQIKCNCKQSRCLKLYCECYANGVYCNKECNCTDCLNNNNYQEFREVAIQTTLERNPQAFQPKLAANIQKINISKNQKGCSCKKSGCLKKYCECYQAGVYCHNGCKCTNCQNRPNGGYGSHNSYQVDYQNQHNQYYLKNLLISKNQNHLLQMVQNQLIEQSVAQKNIAQNNSQLIISDEFIKQTQQDLMKIYNMNVQDLFSDQLFYDSLNEIILQKIKFTNAPNKIVESQNKITKIPVNDIDNDEQSLMCQDEKMEMIIEQEESINNNNQNNISETNIINQQDITLSLYDLKKTIILNQFIKILTQIEQKLN